MKATVQRNRVRAPSQPGLSSGSVAKGGSALRGACLVAAGAVLLSIGAPASVGAAPAAAPGQILIRSSVPGASPLPQPAPDTPVPAWAKESYAVYLEMKAKANGGVKYSRETYSRMPDWSGIWNKDDGAVFDPENVRPDMRFFGPNMAKDILANCTAFPCANYMTADLKPMNELRYRQKLTALVAGIEWDPTTDCLPSGFPRDMLGPITQRYFIATPDLTLVHFQREMGNRTIFTDGRGHLPETEAYPLWVGDSIGFWDNDTLVVHTIHMRGTSLGRVLPETSDQASVVERIRMVDPNTIENKMTMWDPIGFNNPWSGTQRYSRDIAPYARADMLSCSENNNSFQKDDASTGEILPFETVTLVHPYRRSDIIQFIGINRVLEEGSKLMDPAVVKRLSEAAAREAKARGD